MGALGSCGFKVQATINPPMTCGAESSEVASGSICDCTTRSAAILVSTYSKMQNPRHLCKFLILRLALYKQPHLAQFHIIKTSIGAWSNIMTYATINGVLLVLLFEIY
jgi:hypothetical protein